MQMTVLWFSLDLCTESLHKEICFLMAKYLTAAFCEHSQTVLFFGVNVLQNFCRWTSVYFESGPWYRSTLSSWKFGCFSWKQHFSRSSLLIFKICKPSLRFTGCQLEGRFWTVCLHAWFRVEIWKQLKLNTRSLTVPQWKETVSQQNRNRSLISMMSVDFQSLGYFLGLKFFLAKAYNWKF